MAMKTPGVYIVEKNAFPNSVVQVATAVPAFIGHTATAADGARPLAMTPFRVTSMAEFHRYFGGAPEPVFAIAPWEEDAAPSPLSPEGMDAPPALPRAGFTVTGPRGDTRYELVRASVPCALYGAMRHFFLNGGGACYVVSTGGHGDPIEADRMIAAIEALTAEPEPTLLVIPETTRLSRRDAARVQRRMLGHCGTDMGNRFAILDISGGHLPQDGPAGDPVAAFRDDIGPDDLGFGAAYYPWVATSVFAPDDVTWRNIHPDSRSGLIGLLAESVGQDPAIVREIERIGAPVVQGDFTIRVPGGGTVPVTTADVTARDDDTGAPGLTYAVTGDPGRMGGRLELNGAEATRFAQADLEAGRVAFVHDGHSPAGRIVLTVADANGYSADPLTLSVEVADGPPTQAATAPEGAVVQAGPTAGTIDGTLRSLVPLYRAVMDAMAACLNAMPPGAAMAGLYTTVDNSRGVWEAPANVSIDAVAAPMVTIGDAEQEDLDVSATGKAINAIRPFVGEGTLVRGARTLDGNSLDWRHVSVRRTMIMIEQSIRLACRAYATEPNGANTWATIKAMIGTFLTSVWKQGGLAGAVPQDAFGVHAGLGETMTAEDIEDGVLRVTVLVAVTRPAEFIEITFRQRMPTP